MNKKLPKIKKAITDFITSEDAKVIEKSTAKVALNITMLAFSYYALLKNANAHGHHSHTDHTNGFIPESGQNAKINLLNEEYKGTVYHGSTALNYKVPPKSVYSVHGHHLNHSSGGKS